MMEEEKMRLQREEEVAKRRQMVSYFKMHRSLTFSKVVNGVAHSTSLQLYKEDLIPQILLHHIVLNMTENCFLFYY